MQTFAYFHCYAESLDYEVGVCHYEVLGNMVVRQIWVFGENVFWACQTSSKDEQHEFTDQPEWNDGYGAIELVESDRETFTRLWRDSGGPEARL